MKYLLSTFLLGFALFINEQTKAQVVINQQDSLALVDLYNSTGGITWTNNIDWLTTRPVKDWYGITVGYNRVISINLNGNNLFGTIPSSFGNLTQLTTIDLGSNQLNGSIPSSVGNLTKLTSLTLSSNQLTDNIPSSIGNLVQLTNLDLSNNQLTDSIPSSIGQLYNLTFLTLYDNNLNGNIPSSIGNLLNLTGLFLYNNNLSGSIPTSIGKLSKLINLSLFKNQLSGSIPSSIGSLYNLSALQLNNNYLADSIPTSIGGLESLTWLDFSNNKLSGNLPNTLDYLVNLSILNLSNNHLTGGIPIGLMNIINLVNINLEGNNLSGSIPSAIGGLSNLKILKLDLNQFNGNIPQSIGNLINLTTLDISNNLLSDSIPSAIANLKNLQTLNLNNNQLSGPIPAIISNLTNLQTFNLYSNNFIFTDIDLVFSIFSKISLGYSPQNTVHLFKNGDSLFVSVGGFYGDNSYKWYKDGSLIATINYDSTYTCKSLGKYSVVASHTVAYFLNLYSDTINITVLPVSLLSFTATTYNKAITTNWHTSTELNTSHFIIQHSTDGTSFIDIGTVKAIGSGANGYSFTDNNPANGINYYRLESVDKDGASSYSKVVSCELSVVSKQFTVYPNPAKSSVTVRGSHIASVQVMDNIGRVVKVVELKDAANPSLSVSGLGAGVYHLRIQTTDGGVSGAGFVKE